MPPRCWSKHTPFDGRRKPGKNRTEKKTLKYDRREGKATRRERTGNVNRKQTVCCLAAVSLSLAAVLLLFGCGRHRTTKGEKAADLLLPAAGGSPRQGRSGPANRRFTWRGTVRRGPAVTIALRRRPGKERYYTATYERSQNGRNNFKESGAFYLAVLCVKHDPESKLDFLALRRVYRERKRREWLANGKKVDRILPKNVLTPVVLGPYSEPVAGYDCYAFDAQNRLAMRKEGNHTPPYILQYDSFHFLFPCFSAKPKAPGDTWRFTRLEAMLPILYGTRGTVYPTQFPLHLECGLREVKQTPTAKIAVVDYYFSGRFDSAAEPFRRRFPEIFHRDMRIIHVVNGAGTVEVDLERGRLISKVETVLIKTETDRRKHPAEGKKTKPDVPRLELRSRLTLRLLPPGTKLGNGRTVPKD